MEEYLRELSASEKIKAFEERGYFDIDINNDPETIPIKPGEVDYLKKKLSSKIKTRFANFIAFNYFEKLIGKNKLVIKEVKGLENFESIKGGCIITCNHFHPFDNYAIYHVIYKSMRKEGKRDLWKVIREGNYKQWSGLYGLFFKNCNTLPLSSNHEVMREFLDSTKTLLSNGEKILIYPEQALWPDYKKPRPLKIGAFDLAAKNDVPVCPIFITMEDSPYKNEDGTPVNAWTIHILDPIYPNKDLPMKERKHDMLDRNYEAFKKTYEDTYKEELVYTTVK
ncbi:MAG: 1-acyl-sn-glycerol-3-phosphate acyltransferase [Gammaproteobacteria bacterium]|nr:1-acyl-sn-glycerol-3-phosphate acyltransferase [Gammaproteobacteria bacterium]